MWDLIASSFPTVRYLNGRLLSESWNFAAVDFQFFRDHDHWIVIITRGAFVCILHILARIPHTTQRQHDSASHNVCSCRLFEKIEKSCLNVWTLFFFDTLLSLSPFSFKLELSIYVKLPKLDFHEWKEMLSPISAHGVEKRPNRAQFRWHAMRSSVKIFHAFSCCIRWWLLWQCSVNVSPTHRYKFNKCLCTVHLLSSPHLRNILDVNSINGHGQEVL